MVGHPLVKIIFFLVIWINLSVAENISQWRGLNRDGIYHEQNLLKQWPAGGPPLVWMVNGLGAGHTSVSITENRLYITGMPDSMGILYTFDLEGTLLWKRAYGREWIKNYPGPRSTPTVIGNHLYLISGQGHIYCFNAITGKEIWTIDLLNTFGAENIEWGIAESIVIDDEKIICTPGGKKNNVVALNRFNGETIWSSRGHGEPAAYCSPRTIEYNGKRLFITMTAHSILGVDVETGETLWRVYHDDDNKIHANTPLYHEGKILCVSGSTKNSGAVLLGLSDDGKKVQEIWRNERFDNLMYGILLRDGFLYGCSYESKGWFCIDWNNGEIQYVDGALDNGSIVWSDGLFYCYTERGTVALVSADQHRFKIISSFPILQGSGPHWAHPVLSRGRLYIRHGDAIMVYDVSQ